MAFPHDYHRSVWRDFLRAVRTEREPRVNGEEALRGAPADRRIAGERGKRGSGPLRCRGEGAIGS